MSGSLKDAIEKAGIAPQTPAAAEPSREWLHELPSEDERPPYIPFDAPAIIKTKDSKKRPR